MPEVTREAYRATNKVVDWNERNRIKRIIGMAGSMRIKKEAGVTGVKAHIVFLWDATAPRYEWWVQTSKKGNQTERGHRVVCGVKWLEKEGLIPGQKDAHAALKKLMASAAGLED